MSVKLAGKDVEITEGSKDLYVGEGLEGFNTTYSFDIIETRVKTVYVNCDDERSLTEDEAYEVIAEAVEADLIEMEDAVRRRVTIE